MHTSTSTIRRAPIVLTVLLPIVMLAMPTIPAWADAADPAPIHMASSVRSFPKHLVPHRSFTSFRAGMPGISMPGGTAPSFRSKSSFIIRA